MVSLFRQRADTHSQRDSKPNPNIDRITHSNAHGYGHSRGKSQRCAHDDANDDSGANRIRDVNIDTGADDNDNCHTDGDARWLCG